MEKEPLFKRFENYCKNLSYNDKTAILHHADPDGLAAAVITSKAVEKICGKKPKVIIPFRYGWISSGELSKVLKKKEINKLICVDLGLDGFPETIIEAEKQCEIMILDHHKIYRDLNSEKTVFLKVQYFSGIEPSGYVAAKFVFDMFSKLVDVSEKDWIACIGILGDMSYKTWIPFFKKTIAKRKIKLKDLETAVELIESVETICPKNLSKLLKEFEVAKNPKEILSSSFIKYLKELKKDVAFFTKDFKKNVQKVSELELFIYEISPKNDLKSALINRLSLKYPNKTIVLIQKRKGKANFSARRQDFKVKMNEMLENAIKGIPDSSAGGHVPAAAGRIPINFVKQFKKNLVNYLKNIK